MSSIRFLVVAFSEIFITFWPHLVTCRIFSLQPGVKPAPPAVEGRVFDHWTAGRIAASWHLETPHNPAVADHLT